MSTGLAVSLIVLSKGVKLEFYEFGPVSFFCSIVTISGVGYFLFVIVAVV